MPSKTQKKPAKKTKVAPTKPLTVKRTEDGLRLRKLTKRQNAKKLKVVQKSLPLPPAWKLLGQSLRHLYRNKKLFLGILITYGVLYVLFVKGISANFQLGNLRQNLSETLGGKLSSLNTGIALYGLLLGSAGSGVGDAAGIYQTVLVIIISMALIWALRQTYSDQPKVRIRDAFYKGTDQLVPFILVSLVLLVQCLPALIVGSLYSIVRGGGLLVGTPEQVIALIVFGLGMLWTLYMLSSSVFALYIVTLRGATPFASLKAAKHLVRFRRWFIVRKLFFLPVALLVFSALLLVPLIIFAATLAEVTFMLFTIFVIGVVHSYLYSLYRSLL